MTTQTTRTVTGAKVEIDEAADPLSLERVKAALLLCDVQDLETVPKEKLGAGDLYVLLFHYAIGTLYFVRPKDKLFAVVYLTWAPFGKKLQERMNDELARGNPAKVADAILRAVGGRTGVEFTRKTVGAEPLVRFQRQVLSFDDRPLPVRLQEAMDAVVRSAFAAHYSLATALDAKVESPWQA